MKTTTDDRTFPAFQTLIQRIEPDADLERLGDVYGAAVAQVDELQQRTDAAHQELARIDEQLIASPADQSKLLSKRSEYMQALDVFPAALVEAKRRQALAHLYWLQRLRRVALQEARRAITAIAPYRATVQQINRALERDESNGAGFRTIGPEQRTQMQEARHAAYEAMAHDQAQLQLAEQVADITQARAHMAHGDSLDLDHPGGWQDAIAQRQRLITPPIVRSRLHA